MIRSLAARIRVLRTRSSKLLRMASVTLLATAVVSLLTFGILDSLFPFPLERLESWPAGPHVDAIDGQVLLEVTGSDGQWRSPVPLARMHPYLIEATIAVEDERFRWHPGVDPLAVVRALGQNVAQGRVVSGASTLTMQVCRMMEPRDRDLRAKVIEAFRALQLECVTTKEQVIEYYLNVAPYGGNLRGVEAAARYYFGTSAEQLSLSEAALLAGLPQSPNRYRPDRHPEMARGRRNVVLWRLLKCGKISREQYREAVSSPVRIVERRRATRAYHAAWRALQERRGGGQTTIDLQVQDLVEQSAAAVELPSGADVAIVVIDIQQAAIVGLVGSVDPDDPVDGQVNGAYAWRSPGSTLKPFVFATAFENARLNRHSTLSDSPMQRRAWRPENFEGSFRGQVTTAEALRDSLNVPAIRVAEALGVARIAGVSEACGIRRSSARPAGLALVTGACEVRLVDLVNAYATLGRGGIHRPVTLWADELNRTVSRRALRLSACQELDAILSTRARGDELSPWYMWKTGTSSKHRDAWAVGHNGRYAAGVWVGRFNGVGSTDLVGAKCAAPVLERLLTSDLLGRGDQPEDASPLAIERPLTFRNEDRLRIEEPYTGAELILEGNDFELQPRANQPNVQWFLDGQLLGGPRLSLGAGRYQLRCVNAAGESASVWFRVSDPRFRVSDR